MTLPSSWRKSSASSDGQNCVEVRDDLSAVRDSKNPDGGVLELPKSAVTIFIQLVR